MLNFLKIIPLGLLLFFIDISLQAQNIPEVEITNLQYIDGTQISQGESIEIDENGEVRLQFTVDLENPNEIAGVIRVYTTRFSGATRIQRGPQNTVFSNFGTSQSFSYDIELLASDFDANGGELFAVFSNNNNVEYISEIFDISVLEEDNDDDDTPPLCNLPAPTGLHEPFIGFIDVRLDWNPIFDDNVRNYSISYERVDGSSGGSSATLIGSNATFIDIDGLQESTEYKWRVVAICQDGSTGERSSYSFFTTRTPEGTCIQNPPSGTSTSDITGTSAQLNWNPDDGIGYEIGYRIIGNDDGETILISDNTISSVIINNLTPNTDYEWVIRSRCEQGNLSILSSNLINFTTINDCPEDLVISEAATINGDNFKSAQNTITATNTVLNGAIAEYDAGNVVVLSPGFHAQSGATFRAFIEGCTSTRSSGFKSISEETSVIEATDKIEKIITVFPNPTRNTLNIESKDEMVSIQLINQIGNIKTRKQSLQDSRKASFDLSDYPIGLYFLRIMFKGGEIISKTIIKQ